MTDRHALGAPRLDLVPPSPAPVRSRPDQDRPDQDRPDRDRPDQDLPEAAYAAELSALAAQDDGPRPPGWRLSPRAVRRFLLGDPPGAPQPLCARKQFGPIEPIETALAALAAGRALLLLGPPGTGKSQLSALLAAAVGGDSRLVVQGAAGLDETALRYGWNYARLIAEGPSRAALSPSPVLRALEAGRIARIEELTRLTGPVQDALIGPLSERALAIPELDAWVSAAPGFGLIATANAEDRGVFAPSAALLRRFAVVRLAPPETLAEEVALVRAALARRGAAFGAAPAAAPAESVTDALTAAVALARADRAAAARAADPDPWSAPEAVSGAGLSAADVVEAAASASAAAGYLAEPGDRAARFADALGAGLAEASRARTLTAAAQPRPPAPPPGCDPDHPVLGAFRSALDRPRDPA